MAIVFTKLSDSLLAKPKQAIHYVETKLCQLALQVVPESVEALSQSIRITAEGTVNHAKANMLPQPQIASKETCAKERSLFDESVKKQIENKTACCLKAFENPEAQIEALETVEEKRFTYLERPFKDLPKYTGVLVCRTDQADYCLMTVGYLYRPYQVRKELNCHDAIFYQAPAYVVTGVLTDIAQSLATGLLSGFAGKIGALIFDKIFPPGIPSYFDQVYKQIEKIVNQELTQSIIDQINGQINGLKDWVAITYTNAKESGWSKEKLTGLLQPREPQITIQLVAVLMQDRYAEAGITVFMIGAGMHLSILQELALVDPGAASPTESPYAKSVKEFAKKYADYAKQTTEKILQARANKIQAKNETLVPAGSGQVLLLYSFQDFVTGYSKTWINMVDSKGSSNPEAANQRDAAMANYKKAKHDQLVKGMSDPVDTANEWLKLIDQPIPSL